MTWCRHNRLTRSSVLPPGKLACARCGRIIDVRAELEQLATLDTPVGVEARKELRAIEEAGGQREKH